MRYKWVDTYRGIAVLFMATLHFFVNIFPSQPPSFLNYSVRGVISIGDMAVALFLFISGVSTYFSISGMKKRGENEDEAVRRVLFRYSRIFIAGLLLDVILIASASKVWWVLEAIGLSGILALFFICFSDRMKILAVAVIGICYSYLISLPEIYSVVSTFPNGGLLGSVSLSGIVLIGYMCGEYIEKKKKRAINLLVKAGLISTLMGLLLSSFITYDRGIGSFPFVVLSSGFCMLLMAALYWLVELRGVSSGILIDFGKAAFLVFVLNYPVLILASVLKLENSFSTEYAAAITLVLVLLLMLASKVYVSLTEP